MVLQPDDERKKNNFRFRIENLGPGSARVIKSIIKIKIKINDTMVRTPIIKVGIKLL